MNRAIILFFNNYFLLAFALFLILLRLVFTHFNIYTIHSPALSIIEKIFFSVFSIALLLIIIMALIAVFTKEKWLDSFEKKVHGSFIENIINGFFKLVGFAIPVFIFSFLIYLIIFQPWWYVLIFTLPFIAGKISGYLNQKKEADPLQ